MQSGECQIARFGVNGSHLAMLVRSEVNMSTHTTPSLHNHAIVTSTDNGSTASCNKNAILFRIFD